MKKFFKIISILFLSLIIVLSSCFLYFVSLSRGIDFDSKKLEKTNRTIIFYDNFEKEVIDPLTSIAREKIQLDTLPSYVKNAFIAIEDKRFYSHHGIDLRRLISATLKNLSSFSFKEGASTISQQLIKNTHLSSDKTLKRKAQEIKLTKELEKKYSKNQILEMYLNTIYFGENAYGINNATLNYFNKTADKLTLAESAMLAGLIKAPTNYSPTNHFEKAEKRKKLVLQMMLEQNLISVEDFNIAINEKITIYTKSDKNSLKSYLKQASIEINEILTLDPYEKNRTLKIYLYLDKNLQSKIEEINFEETKNIDKSIVMLSNNNSAVSAFYSTVSLLKRSPASTIKPLLVYAPALEHNIISPSTLLLDEKIDFNGYKPTNFNDKYVGYLSARECISQSVNTCAVKILNYLGLEKSKSFAEKLGITFNENDNSLALALGGFTEGLTLKQLCDGYSAFASQGKFESSKFVKKIIDDKGNVLYSHTPSKISAMSEETAYLMNDMLKYTAQYGTCKKLSSLPFEVCGKTGTNGFKNGNLDAYCISYTLAHTLGIWYGKSDNSLMPNDILGGAYPAFESLKIWENTYKTYPDNFQKPKDIVSVKLDKKSYLDEHKLILASDNALEKDTICEIFKKENLPKIKYDEVNNTPKFKIKYINGEVIIDLNCLKDINYLVYKKYDKKKILLCDYKNTNGLITIKDSDLIAGKKYTYYIQTKSIINGKITNNEPIYFPEIYVPLYNDNWWERLDKSPN